MTNNSSIEKITQEISNHFLDFDRLDQDFILHDFQYELILFGISKCFVSSFNSLWHNVIFLMCYKREISNIENMLLVHLIIKCRFRNVNLLLN